MAFPIGIGSAISIGMYLINNRDKLTEIIGEVMDLWKKIKAMVEQAAPDLIPGAPPLPIEVRPDENGFSIEWLQESLNALGTAPTLDVDGEYGPATASAVADFQKENGLTPDKWSGPATTAKILEQLSAQA